MVANRTVSTADQAATAQMTADALATGKFANTYQKLMDKSAELMAARAMLTVGVQSNAPATSWVAALDLAFAVRSLASMAAEIERHALDMAKLYGSVADYREHKRQPAKAQPARAEAEDVEPFDDMTGPMEGGAA